jgi:phospholipase C
MDGFVRAAQNSPQCRNVNDPACESGGANVMDYYDGGEIPNYWTYARDFVLQDHMFESAKSWSLPSHLFMVSGWSARCGRTAMTCASDLQPGFPNAQTRYRWTDMTYLLDKHHVSWRYYVMKGPEPDCQQDTQITCAPKPQAANTPGIWNPLPNFTTVIEDHQLANITPLANFFKDAQAGHLPAVSWIDPSGRVSEHPPSTVSAGQSYVTSLINTVMQSPEWNSTAIFVSWDDWGGFYDHVMPLKFDANGFGLRVPGLVISPYARAGYIDHQRLTYDNYNRFIEYDFLNNQAIDPRTDGRPDRRPSIRETSKQLGHLMLDFDFSQPPRPPELLPVNPVTDLQP